ncbi:hypothetical protein CERZMDRAFT_88323 [Cercospora zeae-maydis SCOH1-5]|uniref:2EXR domain-containing protein n=1 Tax=Cercospora zeae-maydis SCOH1-5 TaxID=717836 RepID=A0A6A6F1Q9_9PEZI|nr:hypothetical protein CERZMDRAFT_88323 [Cercospora zeae-maydis SCOH1-5]
MAQWFPNLPPSGSVKGLSNPFLSQFGDVGFGVCGGGGSLMAKGNFGAALDSDDVFTDTKKAVVPAPVSEFTQKLLAGKQAFDRVNDNHESEKFAMPISDMGLLNRLPGEIRNKIYRFVVVEPKKEIRVTAPHSDCIYRRCRHTKASYNLPALLNTCRQIRVECAHVYFSQNDTILFDQDVVHFRCVGNYIRSIGHYISMVKQIKFMLYRPVYENDDFECWAPYTFTLVTPMFAGTDWFELYQKANSGYRGERFLRLLCDCVLKDMVQEMSQNLYRSFKYDPFIENGPLVPHWVDLSEHLIDFFDSDKFDEYVFQVRKTEADGTNFEKCVYCERICFREDALMSSWY